MTGKKVVMPDTTITREMIEGMRAKLGLKLRVDESTHNEYATRMEIRTPYGPTQNMQREAGSAVLSLRRRLYGPVFPT